MERIKVDTDLLKEKSKVFETSAGVYAQAGSELLSFVAGLPSYDGQLSGPARATALEINRQCQELHKCLLSDAQSLTRTAQAFEEVDNSAIEGINRSINEITNTPIGQYFSGIGKNSILATEFDTKSMDEGGGGDAGISQPFFNPNAYENGYVYGTITILPDGVCKVEDDGKEGDFVSDLGTVLGEFFDWLDGKTGSKKTREKIIGQSIQFGVAFSRDAKLGTRINGVVVTNNSDETIVITGVTIIVNGTMITAKVEGAPIYVHPGETVNIKIDQLIGCPDIPNDSSVTVTLMGFRPDSCDFVQDPKIEDLISITIPPDHRNYAHKGNIPRE